MGTACVGNEAVGKIGKTFLLWLNPSLWGKGPRRDKGRRAEVARLTSESLTRPSRKEQSAALWVQMCRYLHQWQGKEPFTQDRQLWREQSSSVRWWQQGSNLTGAPGLILWGCVETTQHHEVARCVKERVRGLSPQNPKGWQSCAPRALLPRLGSTKGVLRPSPRAHHAPPAWQS